MRKCIRKLEHRKKEYLSTYFMVVVAVILLLLPIGVHADTSGWVDHSSRDETIYGSAESEQVVTSGTSSKVGSINKAIGEFIYEFGDMVLNHILVTDTMDVSVDGIVLGRMSSNQPVDANGNRVSYVQFDLNKGNPWGIIGAIIYVTLRQIVWACFLVLFVAKLIPQLVKNSSKGRAELKEFLANVVIFYGLIYAIPYITDMLIYVRDVIIYVLNNSITAMSGIGATSGLIDAFKQQYEQCPSAIYGFMYTATTCAGIFFMFNYAGTAAIQAILFGSGPVICILSANNRKKYETWGGVFFINIFIPLVDSVILLIPVLIQKVYTANTGDASGSLVINLIMLSIMWAVIPTRNAVLSAFGAKVGVQPRSGMMGLAALGMMAARTVGNLGRRTIGGNIGRGGSHSTAKEDKASADVEKNNADLYRDSNKNISSGMSEIDDVLGGDRNEKSGSDAGRGIAREGSMPDVDGLDTGSSLSEKDPIDQMNEEADDSMFRYTVSDTGTDVDGGVRPGDLEKHDNASGMEGNLSGIDENSSSSMEENDWRTRDNSFDSFETGEDYKELGVDNGNGGSNWQRETFNEHEEPLSAGESNTLGNANEVGNVSGNGALLGRKLSQNQQPLPDLGNDTNRESVTNDADLQNSDNGISNLRNRGFNAGGEDYMDDVSPEYAAADINHPNMNESMSGLVDDEYAYIPNYDSKFAESLSEGDRNRYANLAAKEAMADEMQYNSEQIGRLKELGTGEDFSANAAEIRSLGERNTQIDNELGNLQKEQQQLTEERAGMMVNPGQMDLQRSAEISTQSSQIEKRMGELTAERSSNEGRISSLQSRQEATAARRQEISTLESRNMQLSNGIENCEAREKAFAASNRAVGMSAQRFDSASDFKVQKLADENRKALANYKNFDGGNFKDILTPQERENFYRQRAQHKTMATVAKGVGTAAGVLVGAGVGVAAASTAAYGGPSMMAGAAGVAGVTAGKVTYGAAYGAVQGGAAVANAASKALPNLNISKMPEKAYTNRNKSGETFKVPTTPGYDGSDMLNSFGRDVKKFEQQNRANAGSTGRAQDDGKDMLDAFGRDVGEFDKERR